MAYIKGNPGNFFFEVRDLETGALFPGCTFSKTIVYVDGNADINTSTSPSFEAWSTLNASLSECRISGSASGLWSVSIPTLPNDCETLTFHFIPTSGLNVHVPLVTISLENAPAESVDISGLATSAELESVRHELSSGISTSTQEIGRIPYNVWNYALPSNISSSYVGGYLKNMYTSVNSIQQDMPNAAEISLSVWSEAQRTLTSPVISDSVRLATKDNVSDAREYIVLQCATASGFATPANVTAAQNAVLSEMETLATAVSAQDIQTVSNEIKSAVETINTSVNAIASDVDKVETYTDQLEGMVSELPTSSGIASAVWSHDSRDLTRYEVADLSGVAKTSDLVTVAKVSDLANVAKSSEVEAAKSAILAGCRTASGFATSQEVEAAKEAILTDCATASGFATPEDVISAAELVPENVWNYGTDFNARTVKANGVSLDGTDLSVQVDSAEIANAVWTRTVRTLTSGDNIDFPEFDTSVLDTLATSAEIQAIADGRKLTDLAVPADLVVNTTTEKVEVVSQTVDLTDLKTYGDTNWKTAEGFAEPEHVTAAQSAIISQCRTATGFATPEDVKLTTTTETVEVVSQTVDLSGIPASVWNYGTIADRVVTAGSVEISGDVQVDASSIAAAVWSSPERELTQNVAAPADVNSAKMEILSSCATASGFAKPSDVVSAKNEIVEKCATATGFATVAGLSAAKNEILTNCATASGFATPANVTAARDSILSQCRTATGFATPADVKLTTTTQTVDLTDLKTYGDVHWKTAEGFARAETVDPALNLISALIKRWKVSGSTLTAYGNSGEVLGTFTLVKDTSGNIIEVR